MYPIKLEVNRPLSNAERSKRLDQKLKNSIFLNHNLSIVSLNSTYLETADKYYPSRGWFTLIVILVFIVLLYPTILMPDMMLSSSGLLFPLIFMCLFLIFLLLKDSFGYTYSPIRFNRKTGMVYVFNRKGKVETFPWNDIFFCIGKFSPAIMSLPEFDIRGHILDKEQKKVLHSFELGVSSGTKDEVLAHWELIRSYMEDGPEVVAPAIDFCLPIIGNRAGSKFELLYCFGIWIWEGAPRWLLVLLSPMVFVFGLSRCLAMRTSKVPHWPKDVEDACSIENNDPIVIDAKNNQTWTWTHGWFKKKLPEVMGNK